MGVARILAPAAILLGGCAMAETTGGPGPKADLPVLGTLWDWDDLAASEGRFREAAARGRAAGDEPYALEADTQVARTMSLRDRFEEAHAILDAVEQRLPSNPPAVRVRYLLERGRTLNSSGSPAKANPLFREAYGASRGAGLAVLALDAAHMVALVEEPEEALRWAYRAMEDAEASADRRARGWLGPLYNNTGWTHYERGEFGKALDLWRKGVAVRQEMGETDLRIGRRTVATGLRATGRPGDALDTLERIHREDPAANEADGYWQEEMGETLLLLGRRDEARPRFARAYEILRQDEWLAGHEAPRLERLRREGSAP